MSALAQRRFLGLAFCDAGPEAMAALLASRPQSAPFSYLVTPNADHFVRLRRMPALLPLYEAASWRTLDSQAIARAAGMLGLVPPKVATGADILAALLDRHLQEGDRITIIGLAPEGMAQLRLRFPGIRFAHHCPPMGLAEGQAEFAEALAFARAHPARFTLIALGSPLQERFAGRLAAEGGHGGAALCIGAALDFWTGLRTRAPGWMRRAGLEWAWRLGSEPRRLGRRYLCDDPAILLLLLQERARNRARQGPCWPAKPSL